MIQILFGIWLCLLKQSCREFYGEQFFFLPQSVKSFVKSSKVSFKILEKRNSKKKKRKGDRRCWADPPPFRPSEAARPSSPSPLSRARRPPRSTQRRPRGGRTPASWTRRGRPAFTRSGRRPTPPGHSILSPPHSPLLPPLASAAAVAVPPQRHRRKSPAAHRRSRQWPILGAKATTALAFATVSFCARSTEVRGHRTP